jgi:hypothetical protein
MDIPLTPPMHMERDIFARAATEYGDSANIVDPSLIVSDCTKVVVSMSRSVNLHLNELSY